MSITHLDLITLANELKTGATEAHWRSSMSRGYYAAYHGCQSWHAALPAPGSLAGHQGGSHQQLFNQLANPAPEVKGDPRAVSKTLSTYLSLLHIKRCKADYQLDTAIDQATAETACLEAQFILAKL